MNRKVRKLLVKLATHTRRVKDFAAHEDPVDKLLRRVRSAGADTGLEEKVVVITGSSAGIGLALAHAFIQKGARVVLNGRDEQRLNAALGKIRDPRKAVGVLSDISTPQGASQLLHETLKAFGQVDILINNAGLLGPHDRKAWEVAEHEWSAVLQTNVTGPFLCAQAFMKWMIEHQREGRIINVSSGITQAPVLDLAPYGTAKIALEGLTRALARDADGTGIMVTCIQAGSVRTPMAKRFFGWKEYELLPPAESLAPVFWHAATANPSLLHGRVIAAWRYNLVGEAESRLAMPISGVERFTFGDKDANGAAHADMIILNRAENQLGTPQHVTNLLGTAASSVWRYPDPDYGTLRHMLAEKLGLGAEYVTFGNGSAELVERILRVFVKPGEAVISNDPSWFMFDRFAHMFGVLNEKVPFVEDAVCGYQHNLEGVLKRVRGDTRLIYLIHPSNPVGVPLLHQSFAAFLERVPAHIPVVVDEAYVEYADHPQLLDTPRLVKETDRMLLGLRTFSKFYGLAGMRVGYGYSHPRVIALLGRLELTFNVSSVSAMAAAAALRDATHAERTRSNCIAERARIGKFLRSVGLDFVPTQGSMMMFEPPTEAQAFYRALEREGIVAPRGVFFGKYTLWPIGLPEQNDRIMAVVARLTQWGEALACATAAR